jgi:hypothetical protein
MKKLAIFSVFCGFLAIFWGGSFASQAYAIPGDVNGNGVVELGDIIYLRAYLYQDAPAPPNPIDADVDGSPGINMGDVLQLIGYLYAGCSLLPYTGATIKESKEILFYADAIRNVGNGNPQTIEIKIIKNNGPDLMGMIIPISYANKPGDVDVTLNSVTFAGSIIPTEWWKPFKTDNVNKRVLLYIYPNTSTDPPITTGTVGLVAKLNFSQNTQIDTLSHTPSVTEFPPSHSFMLIKSFCADTVHNSGNSPSERIFTTENHLTVRGDANCSGEVELGDIVQLIRYLYFFAPAPLGL